MLSYRHAYHAGNFADVMKHVVLTALLRYMTRKDAPVCYIDTHAGAGGYDLQAEYARKTSESDMGIGRLWGASDAPEPVAVYLDLVHRFNPGDAPVRYPGSPWFAAEVLREQDRLMLCELHGSDFPLLQKLFQKDRRVRCYPDNGYQFSIGLVPPIERRGLILMDPSFELKDEYATALATIRSLHRRFATGTYALWYPILDERRTAMLKREIDQTRIRDVMNIDLTIADRHSLPGMYGCGMLVINPPWTLREDMELALPYLISKLALNGKGAFHIERWADE